MDMIFAKPNIIGLPHVDHVATFLAFVEVPFLLRLIDQISGVLFLQESPTDGKSLRLYRGARPTKISLDSVWSLNMFRRT